jgi:CCR4-NOT transcriptional regulation complex NOT5 subunit
MSEQLKSLIAEFDPYYEFSDDSNVYDKHSKLEQLIKNELKKLGIKKTIDELKRGEG